VVALKAYVHNGLILGNESALAVTEYFSRSFNVGAGRTRSLGERVTACTLYVKYFLVYVMITHSNMFICHGRKVDRFYFERMMAPKIAMPNSLSSVFYILYSIKLPIEFIT
jgi:hypothetical protein